MNNLKKILTILLISFTGNILFSQSQFIQNQQSLNPISDGYLNYVNNNKNKSEKIDLASVKGSPYENVDFVLGKALERITKNTDEFYMRYNVYNDIIETKKNLYDKTATDLIKSENVYAKIGNNRYHYRSYLNEDGKSESGYFILISSRGDNRLYLKKGKKFIPKKESTSPYDNGSSASFKDYQKYYFEISNSLIPIPEKKKALLKEFPISERGKLNTFIKNKKINIKKKEDLIKLLNFLSTN